MLRTGWTAPTLTAALFALGASSAAAGVVPDGSIAVVSLYDQQFSLVDPASGAATAYALTNTTGVGTGNTNAVLWDPAQPDSFFLGGEGFVGRVTITGPGTSQYTLLTNQVGGISQLSFDAAGDLVAIDSTSDQVLRVDASSGAITPLTSGAQPWGADANAGVFDPATGDLYVGANDALWVRRAGQPTFSLLSSGWTQGQFAFATTVLVEPGSGDLIVSILTEDRVVRMDAQTGAFTDIAPPHSIQSCNSLAIDGNGDFVVAGWENKVWRVPKAGGAPTLLSAAIANQGLIATAVAVVESSCLAQATAYGAGCAGTAGFVPTLAIEGCTEVGSAIQLEIKKGLGGSAATLLFGLGPASSPLGGGCSLLIAPVVGPILVLPLGGAPGAGGAGSLVLPGVFPAGASGANFTLQAFVADPSTVLGASATNGLAIGVP